VSSCHARVGTRAKVVGSSRFLQLERYTHNSVEADARVRTDCSLLRVNFRLAKQPTAQLVIPGSLECSSDMEVGDGDSASKECDGLPKKGVTKGVERKVRVFRTVKTVAQRVIESDGSRSGDPMRTATTTGEIVRRFEFNKDGSLNKNYYDFVRPVRVRGVQNAKTILLIAIICCCMRPCLGRFTDARDTLDLVSQHWNTTRRSLVERRSIAFTFDFLNSCSGNEIIIESAGYNRNWNCGNSGFNVINPSSQFGGDVYAIREKYSQGTRVCYFDGNDEPSSWAWLDIRTKSCGSANGKTDVRILIVSEGERGFDFSLPYMEELPHMTQFREDKGWTTLSYVPVSASVRNNYLWDAFSMEGPLSRTVMWDPRTPSIFSDHHGRREQALFVYVLVLAVEAAIETIEIEVAADTVLTIAGEVIDTAGVNAIQIDAELLGNTAEITITTSEEEIGLTVFENPEIESRGSVVYATSDVGGVVPSANVIDTTAFDDPRGSVWVRTVMRAGERIGLTAGEPAEGVFIPVQLAAAA
jgi:hypothetical protein